MLSTKRKDTGTLTKCLLQLETADPTKQQELTEILANSKIASLPPRGFQRNFNSSSKELGSKGKSTTAMP